MSDNDKRALPKISQKDTLNRNRKTKKKKTIHDEEDISIRDSIEMPSLKRINSKQSMISASRRSRHQPFSEDTNINNSTSNIIKNNNTDKIKNTRKKKIRKQINENGEKTNRENDIKPNIEIDTTNIIPPKAKARSAIKKVKKLRILKSPRNDRIGIENQLTSDLDDDIVTTLPTAEKKPIEFSDHHNNYMRSESNKMMFIESADGFVGAKKVDLERKRMKYNRRLLERKTLEEQYSYNFEASVKSSITMCLAMRANKKFLTFSLFCHGLLAGIALWHIITVMTYLDYSYYNLLSQYCTLSKPLQALYFLLFVICTISSFDRYDVHIPNKDCFYGSISCATGGLSIPVYLLGLIFHLWIAPIEEKISLCDSQEWNSEQSRDDDLRMWWILSLVRSLFAIMGWMCIVITPNIDRLHSMLENILDEDILPKGVIVKSHLDV